MGLLNLFENFLDKKLVYLFLYFLIKFFKVLKIKSICFAFNFGCIGKEIAEEQYFWAPFNISDLELNILYSFIDL